MPGYSVHTVRGRGPTLVAVLFQTAPAPLMRAGHGLVRHSPMAVCSQAVPVRSQMAGDGRCCRCSSLSGGSGGRRFPLLVLQDGPSPEKCTCLGPRCGAHVALCKGSVFSGDPPPPAATAHKSVLETANPRIDSDCAPGQRHGQQPVSRRS